MNFLDLLVSNLPNSLSFHNLALFICHLFIDGHFRIGHVVYDPNVFDVHLFNEIESICPVPIPWLTTDITQFQSSDPWQTGDPTDHILQLIFFDPHHLGDEIIQFKNQLTIYRAFIFTSTMDGINNPNTPIIMIKQLDRNLGLRSLIVQYDSENVQWIGENGDFEKVFDDKQGQRNIDKYERLFDRTFGKFEQSLTICIRSIGLFAQEKDAALLKPSFAHQFLYMSNYFNVTLDKSYVSMLFTTFNSPHGFQDNNLVVRKERKYHKELSLEYEAIRTINGCKLDEENPIELFFSSTALMPYKGTLTYSLYPYDSAKLTVIFVYGTDFTRGMNFLLIPEAIQIISACVTLFMGLAALILSVIRRKLNLPRSGPVSTFIDTLIAFISGGNLQMKHKLERWFFAILLIGAFFIMSLFAGDLLDCIIRILNQKFTHLEQLKGINTPFYVALSIKRNLIHIEKMLRNKIDENINFRGTILFRIVSEPKPSFVAVIDERYLDIVLYALKSSNQDFDILQESLGVISKHFYLQAKFRIPRRVQQKIERSNSLMMQSGINEFYTSLAEYGRKLSEKKDSGDENYNDDDLQALTMNQLERPLMLLLSLFGIIAVIFICEILVNKWNNWQWH